MATVKPKFYVIGSALSLLKSLSKRPRGQFAFGFDVRLGPWQAQALIIFTTPSSLDLFYKIHGGRGSKNLKNGGRLFVPFTLKGYD